MVMGGWIFCRFLGPMMMDGEIWLSACPKSWWSVREVLAEIS
jgi:hypothetical protein